MGDKTKIQWCDATINAWHGCARVNTGCLHCFAERQAGRFGVEWGAKVPRRYIPSWRKTLAKVAARARREGRKLKVFINDMSDLFDGHDGDVVDAAGRLLWIHHDTEWISESVGHNNTASVRSLKIADLRRQVFFEIDRYADCLNFLLLTKRPQNIPKQWCGVSHPDEIGGDVVTMAEFRPNVAILYSASEQKTLDAGLSDLLRCGRYAPVLGLSLEPLTGEIVIPTDAIYRGARLSDKSGLRYDGCKWPRYDDGVLGWVIVGCEQLTQHRPGRFSEGYAEAAADIIQQCRQSSVPMFHKQMPIGNVVSGEPSEWPEQFRVREYPEFLS